MTRRQWCARATQLLFFSGDEKFSIFHTASAQKKPVLQLRNTGRVYSKNKCLALHEYMAAASYPQIVGSYGQPIHRDALRASLEATNAHH